MLAALATVACDVEGALDDLEQQAIDNAFKSIQDNARSQGGDAILVRPGSEYVIEITDVNSPIKGAKVVIPAAAIPADIEQAVVAIAGVKDNAALKSNDSLKLAGPIASIGFTKVPGGEEVAPLANLLITLPYTAQASAPAEQIVLADYKGDGSLVVYDDNKADGKTVSGGGKIYNLFGAFWKVDYDGTSDAPANSFIYKVTSADGTKSCSGIAENVADRLGDHRYYYSGSAGGFVYNITMAGVLTIDTSADMTVSTSALPVGTSMDVTLTGPFGAWNVGCADFDKNPLGGNVQTANAFSLTVANFVETSVGAEASCGSDMCVTHTGALDIDASLDFVASDGSTVKAKLKTTVPDFTWDILSIP